MSDVIVSVPARADFVHILRTVVAGVVARLDASYDAIEDLRIAVDEACAHLLSIRRGATILSVRITPAADHVVVVASTDAAVEDAPWPPADAERSLTWQVLTGLTDEAAFERRDGRPAVRMMKRVPPLEGGL